MKIVKTKKGLAVLLPSELVFSLGLKEGDNLEFKNIHGDVYAIFPATPAREKKEGRKKGERREQEIPGKLSEKEIEVLRKLSRIRFDKRTEREVERILTKEEMKILKGLLKKKAILKMTHGKYEKQGGVYSISRDYFGLLKEEKPKAGQASPLVKELEKSGYLVLEDQKEAEELVSQIRDELETGMVLAIKGFDKKFYFITQKTLAEVGNKVRKVISDKAKRVETIASEVNEPVDLVKAVLEILRESGEVLEKRKNTYVIA